MNDEKKELKVEVRYETRQSKKTNEPYDVLVLAYGEYEKVIFLDPAEKIIFKGLKK